MTTELINANRRIEELERQAEQLTQQLKEERNRRCVLQNVVAGFADKSNREADLEAQLAELREIASILRKENEKLRTDKHSIDIQTAKILCYAVNGCKAKEIVDKLAQEDIGISHMTVYRALSVKEDNDMERIMLIMASFPEVFSENNVSKQDLLGWYNRR